MTEVTFLNEKKEAEFIERINFKPILPENVEFVFKNSLTTSNEYCTCFESACGLILKEITTKRDSFGNTIGKPKSYFFLKDEVVQGMSDDDFKINEFDTLEGVVEAYNIKKQFESENLIEKGYRVILKPTIVLI